MRLVFLFLLSTSGFLFAQSIGRIGGTVVDPTGAIVPDAPVVCVNADTGLRRSVQTTRRAFSSSPICHRQLLTGSVQARLRRSEAVGISLLTGQNLEIILTLTIGDSKQTVEVKRARLYPNRFFQRPNLCQPKTDARSAAEWPQRPATHDSDPGYSLTNVGTESGQQDNTGLSVNGLRATQNNFRLDGTLYTNRFFDSVPTMPDPDALEEFTIQSSNYSAEFGGAGALVQLSTRSGSNEIHGTAFSSSAIPIWMPATSSTLAGLRSSSTSLAEPWAAPSRRIKRSFLCRAGH